MIRVNEDWIIDVDNYNYILKKDLHKKIKQKNNNETVMVDAFETVGYYGVLSGAFEALGNEIIKDKLATASCTLAEATGVLKECRDEWKQLVDEVKGASEWQN